MVRCLGEPRGFQMGACSEVPIWIDINLQQTVEHNKAQVGEVFTRHVARPSVHVSFVSSKDGCEYLDDGIRVHSILTVVVYENHPAVGDG